MSRTDRAALGRFVLRTKEYLVAIRAREQALRSRRCASTTRSARPTGIPSVGGRTKKAEVDRNTRKGGKVTAPKEDKTAAEPSRT